MASEKLDKERLMQDHIYVCNKPNINQMIYYGGENSNLIELNL